MYYCKYYLGLSFSKTIYYVRTCMIKQFIKLRLIAIEILSLISRFPLGSNIVSWKVKQAKIDALESLKLKYPTHTTKIKS